jgi:hypothetical protein
VGEVCRRSQIRRLRVVRRGGSIMSRTLPHHVAERSARSRRCRRAKPKRNLRSD